GAGSDGFADELAGIGDVAGQGAGGDGQGAGQVDAGVLVAHASGEIAVGGADAVDRLVESTEGVLRAAQTRGAARSTDLAAGVHEDVVDALFAVGFGLAADVESQHVGVDLGGAWYHEGGNFDLFPLQHGR